MSLEQFGPFADAFGQRELDVPGYLELLHLANPGVQVVIDRIERAALLDEAPGFVDALFDDPNWRPHLVGAIALVAADGRLGEASALWRAVDAGSWVTPQLVVTALFVDPRFSERLVERMESSCPISPPAGLSPIEQHSATGPANTVQRSAKLLASLLSVGKAVPKLSVWLGDVRAQPAVVEMLQHDVDDASNIADAWRKQLVAQFARRGRVLVPKAA